MDDYIKKLRERLTMREWIEFERLCRYEGYDLTQEKKKKPTRKEGKQ